MQKRSKIVLDIGSNKLTLCCGKRGVNGTFVLQCLAYKDYAGFSEGEFLEIDNLQSDIQKALDMGKTNKKSDIKNVTIGVPSEFCLVKSCEVTKHFGKKVKLTEQVIQEVAETSIEVDLLEDKKLISCNALWVKLDDERVVYDWKNVKTTKLTAEISYIYVENTFIDTINEILTNLGVESVEYICSAEAQSRYLLENEDIARKCVIIDVGYISSSVSLACGNGLYDLKAFSYGGGHIAADLSECLDITFEQGEALKREIVLSINSKKSEDYYEVDVKDKILPVSINFANEIVKARLDMICGLIKKILSSFGIENSQYVPVYLTGGGISYIKGSRDYLAKSIGRNVQLLAPLSPGYCKPHLSSVISVLNSAL